MPYAEKSIEIAKEQPTMLCARPRHHVRQHVSGSSTSDLPCRGKLPCRRQHRLFIIRETRSKSRHGECNIAEIRFNIIKHGVAELRAQLDK